MAVLHGWRFCPRCRAELERNERRVSCLECGFVMYATSQPTACAIVVGAEERVLLARRANEPYAGLWDLPGGFLEEGEHPLHGLVRELREETGLEVEPVEFVGIWIDRYGGGEDAPATLNLYWRARPAAGEPVAADDVAELEWFAVEELPPAGEFAFHVADVLSTWRGRQEKT